MKNKLLYVLTSKININVKGIYIERFIKRLYKNNIDILNLVYISKDEINIKIYKRDYEKVMKLRTIYKICIISYSGVVRVRENIKYNKYIIIFLIICLAFIYVISNIIFDIQILSNDEKLKKSLYYDLSELGIKKYNFKKNYNDLLKVKKKILNNYKDEIEWIEIESIGTKYIVKYEPRVIKKIEEKEPIRDIVAKKDSVIRSMNISRGVIVKGVDSYVKKGDVIVSGSITLNDTNKDYTSSKGEVFGEVWYKTIINYPYKYKEEKLTNNKKRVLVLTLLNKKIFFKEPYKEYNEKNMTIFKNNLLPFSLDFKTIREKKVIDLNLKKEQAVVRATKLGKKKIEARLKQGEYINDYKVIDTTPNKNNVSVEIFYSVVENIGEYRKIEKEQIP